jgi:hypothetical protein
MENKSKLILAQMQIDNLLSITKEGPYQAFIYSHLLPVKYELQRQLHLLTTADYYPRIKE